MKQFLLFVSLSSVFLLSDCRKDKTSPDPIPEISTVVDCTLDTFTFSKVLQGTDEYKDVIQDRGKRIVAITQNKIERYDMKGLLEWSKPLAQVGTMQNIVQADNDNYFVTAANRQIDDFMGNEFYAPGLQKGVELHLFNYWKSTGNILENCLEQFQLISKSVDDFPDDYVSRATPPKNNSTCTLFKLNHQGELIWTKQFKGNRFIGKSLATSPDGNWFLLTYQSSGFYKKAAFDVNGNFQDTIYMPLKENSVTLYKFNSDGTILWEKKITGISNNYSFQYSPDENPVFASLAVTSNSVCIQTQRDYIVLDQNGNTLQRRRPGAYFCSAEAYSIAVQSDLFYSIGREFDPADNRTKPYLQVSGSNGDVISQTFPEQAGIEYKIETAKDGVFLGHNTGITKYSISGTRLWPSPLEWLPGSYIIGCATPTCSGGIILFKKNFSGQIELIKTDANGKY